MFQEIYIIDCENELVMMLRERFEKEKMFRFKNINPSNLDMALRSIPNLIIVNEQSINTDVIELCKKIRENEDNSITPVLVVSSSNDEEHKISIMKNNIEYIIPNVASEEYLFYAIRNITRLLSVNRTVSPLTALPGNVQIQTELKKRLLRKEPFQVLYLDLDNFKAYNDVYGFLKGDEIIKLTAKIITKNIHLLEESDVFVGHIGGDDFVAIVDENVDYDKICQDIIAEFDKEILEYNVELPNGTEKINISAKTADSTAKVSGIGEVSVVEGANKIIILIGIIFVLGGTIIITKYSKPSCANGKIML